MSDAIAEAGAALALLLSSGGVTFAQESAKNAANDVRAAAARILSKLRRSTDDASDADTLSREVRDAVSDGRLDVHEVEHFIRLYQANSSQIQNNIGTINAKTVISGSDIRNIENM